MIDIAFSKYHGTGNDFILIDDRKQKFPLQCDLIKKLCHRHYGIGADGLILLAPSEKADYAMRMFNADGHETTMCGNGLRCLLGFLRDLGIEKEECSIELGQNVYIGCFHQKQPSIYLKHPKMIEELGHIEILDNLYSYCLVDTGVPHLVIWSQSLAQIQIEKIGRLIRLHPRFAPHGVNVNFAQLTLPGRIDMHTYERGVERETLSCGSGAAAVCFALWKQLNSFCKLQVYFNAKELVECEWIATRPQDSILKIQGEIQSVFSGVVRAS